VKAASFYICCGFRARVQAASMAQLVPIDLIYLENFDHVCTLRHMCIQIIRSTPKTIWGASLQ